MPVLLAYQSILPIGFWGFVNTLADAMRSAFWCLTAFLAGVSVLQSAHGMSGTYLLGLGIGDITGPVVETAMMGYSIASQVDTGLHMRQYSRAFIVADPTASNRIVFINADIAMGDSGVRRSIVRALSSRYPGIYTDDNIAFVGTHQHAGVGGYLENLLPQLPSLGYVPETANAIIAGTVLAVRRAHNSLAPGRLRYGNTTILDANISRSPSAYLANPAEERARYLYDQDKDMTVLRFDDSQGNARGFLSFFAVHGTSLYNNNTLVSTDNKGMAAYLYESYVEPNAMPGNRTFIAGFAQANVGDTTPNTLGAYCESPGKPYDGMPCEINHSICGSSAVQCRGRGPGFRISDFESCRINAEKQFLGAQTVMNGALSYVTGPVKSVHTYMAMANHTFTLPNGTTVSTCPAALGYAFAAGTTDGPGAFDFIQGVNSTSPRNVLWDFVKAFVTPMPSELQQSCQYPKPVLLNTGYAHLPYEWAPNSVNIQVLRVGNFVMLIVPGEFTTMAGRRIREAVRDRLISSGILGPDAYVVLSGPANAYGHYVTTREEYSVQRYEGASTVFGPFTLEAYIDKYTSLVPNLADGAAWTPASDPPPPEQTSNAISLRTPVVYDGVPSGRAFGSVLLDVRTSAPYHAGGTVTAVFLGANPRNNLRLEDTFLSIDRQNSSGQWLRVRTDSHPSTIYRWARTNGFLAYSNVTISWTIEPSTPAGTYRIRYYGDAKPFFGSVFPFTGTSSSFTIS